MFKVIGNGPFHNFYYTCVFDVTVFFRFGEEYPSLEFRRRWCYNCDGITFRI